MISDQTILNASILIVDDQPSNVLLLEEMLHDAGYTSIKSTTDPYAVADLYRSNHYDLVLLDLQMPGMDGFQVMEELKKIEADAYLPVLVITAQPDHKLRALAAGAKDFVSKPLDLIEVQTRIHNMLEVRLLYKELKAYKQELEQVVQERTAELRKSEARFRRLTELSSDWYWEQDEQGNFIKVYGPVQEMLGIPFDSALCDANDKQAVSWDQSELAVLTANIAARRPFLDLVCSRINAEGGHQFFQVSGEPMFDGVGRFTGFRGVGRDVTNLIHDITHPHLTGS
jgi:PAS domain S-box-containing protein